MGSKVHIMMSYLLLITYDQWYPSTATPMKKCMGLCLKKKLIWAPSTKIFWSAYEFFSQLLITWF